MPKKLMGRLACLYYAQTSVKMAVLLHKQAKVPYSFSVTVCIGMHLEQWWGENIQKTPQYPVQYNAVASQTSAHCILFTMKRKKEGGINMHRQR